MPGLVPPGFQSDGEPHGRCGDAECVSYCRPRGSCARHTASALRQWFGHDPTLWEEFEQRYAAELQPHAEPLDALRALARKGTVTLVYGAHDEAHNNAVALRTLLLALPDKPPGAASA